MPVNVGGQLPLWSANGIEVGWIDRLGKLPFDIDIQLLNPVYNPVYVYFIRPKEFWELRWKKSR